MYQGSIHEAFHFSKPQPSRDRCDGSTDLLARLDPIVAAARDHAAALDADASSPTTDIAALRSAGALEAVVPIAMGGLGIGTEPQQASISADILYRIGCGSIALGRLYEAHLNAIRSIMRNATEAVRAMAAIDVAAGHLFALWVTDAHDALRYREAGKGITLDGGKSFCSAACHATRAVVTATDPSGNRRLLLLSLGRGEAAACRNGRLQGVRSATTGQVDFSGSHHPADAAFGAPGAYLQEPDFSTGAWRTCAILGGALATLVDAARAELVARNRADNPLQRERLGRMMVHAQTANLWIRHIAPIADVRTKTPVTPSPRSISPALRSRPPASTRSSWCSARSAFPRLCRIIRSSACAATSPPICASRPPISH